MSPYSAANVGTGSTVDGEGVYIVTMHLTAAQIDAVIDAFDERSPSSPSADDCRRITRPLVIACRDARGQG